MFALEELLQKQTEQTHSASQSENRDCFLGSAIET